MLMQDSEESLHLSLLIERLANVARDQGARKGAERDVARRLVEDHKAETLTGGVVRLGSGSSVHDAIEALRANLPEYFTAKAEPVAAPAPAPVPTPPGRRKRRGAERLALANGDTPPSLIPAPRRKPGEAA